MQEALQEGLKLKRAESLQQLKDNGDEITGKEEEIFEVGRKLKKGLEENHKFQQVRSVLFFTRDTVVWCSAHYMSGIKAGSQQWKLSVSLVGHGSSVVGASFQNLGKFGYPTLCVCHSDETLKAVGPFYLRLIQEK